MSRQCQEFKWGLKICKVDIFWLKCTSGSFESGSQARFWRMYVFQQDYGLKFGHTLKFGFQSGFLDNVTVTKYGFRWRRCELIIHFPSKLWLENERSNMSRFGAVWFQILKMFRCALTHCTDKPTAPCVVSDGAAEPRSFQSCAVLLAAAHVANLPTWCGD